MGATVSCLSVLQKYINSKQKILKQKKQERAGLNGWVSDFSVAYRAFDTSHIINAYKYLMKKNDIK